MSSVELKKGVSFGKLGEEVNNLVYNNKKTKFKETETKKRMFHFQSWARHNFLASRQRQRDNVIYPHGPVRDQKKIEK